MTSSTPLSVELDVVRIRLGRERPVPQPDPLGNQLVSLVILGLLFALGAIRTLSGNGEPEERRTAAGLRRCVSCRLCQLDGDTLLRWGRPGRRLTRLTRRIGALSAARQ